jgi:ABC-2 type transport system ATP-binding protein
MEPRGPQVAPPRLIPAFVVTVAHPVAYSLPAMIEVSGLIKDFGAVRAVDRVTFAVAQGEVVGFLGPNGAGKTTTLRVLTGFHPATAGSVRVFGLDVLTDSLRVRAGLGYLPENVPIYPDLRVEEYLAFRAALKGVPRRLVRARVVETMELAGVTEVRRRLVGHVSRGYRQRVGLADVLVAQPQLLVLDEPTSGLDPNQRRRVRELVAGLKARHTILFSSHILSDVEAVCDRVLVIHRGRLLADGPIQELSRRLGVTELRLRTRAREVDVAGLLAGLPVGAPRVGRDADGLVTVACPLTTSDRVAEDAALDAGARRAAELGIELREFHLHRPTLEELFFSLTAIAEPSEETAA